MKRYFLTIFLALFISFVLSNQVLASEDDYVKIGLKSPLKSVFSVNLSSEGFRVGKWKDGYNALFNIDESRLTVRIDGYYINIFGNYTKADDVSAATCGPFHIRTNKAFTAYDEASYEVKKLRSLNIDAFVYYNQDFFEIWIGQFISERKAMEEAAEYMDYLNNLTDIALDSKDRIMILNENNEIVLMFDKNQDIHLSSLSTQYKDLVKVEGASYRDFITFSRNENELVVINNVSIQHYLYGVVPKEMPPSWPLEALKAQAIAAKNYALLYKNKHSNEGYELCDTQHCQVYGGYNSENIMTNKAVDETSGKILTYNGKLVDAYYHSSSGGFTENSENVWSNSFPYLSGVKDDFSLGSPYDTWQFVISEEEIRNKLFENGLDVGYITEVEILSTSPSGRVQELMVKGTMGTQILAKEKTRQIFGTSNIKSTLFKVKFYGEGSNISTRDIYIYNFSNGDIIKKPIAEAAVITSDGLSVLDSIFLSNGITISDGSSTYEIYNELDNNSIDSVGKYVFIGKGWGHGVGMSQWGAKKMAELGYDYVQILEHYYTGAIVE